MRAEHAKKPNVSATPPIRRTVFRPFKTKASQASVSQPEPFRPRLTITKQLAPGFKHYKSSIDIAEVKKLVGRDDPLIIELGAHHGEDTQKFLDAFPRGLIHAFECDPRALTAFQSNVADRRCILHKVAVADVDGCRTFYQSGGHPRSKPEIADWDHSSSILAPVNHLKEHPWCTFDKQCAVPAMSLNTWRACNAYRLPEVISYVHADIQGAEYLAVKGGGHVFARTCYFYAETDNSEMYKSQQPPDAIIEMLGPHWACLATYSNCNMLLVNRNLVP